MPLPYADRITQKLEAAFAPCRFTLKDESHKHAGHASADPAGETHFSLMIVSDKFVDLNRIQRHQAIYAVLEDELKERVHALRIKASTPEEEKSSR